MASLSVFSHDFGDAKIRATSDKRFSVYDVLVAFLPVSERKGKAGAAINPRQVFKSIKERNPEVVHFCDNFKFPGAGQRETPVADEEGIYQILMLCPGQRGAEFRKWAAGIIANPDKALDHAVCKYRQQGRSPEWIEQRFQGVISRHRLTDVLKAHGVAGSGYALCTDAINAGVLGQTAQQLKRSRDTKNTRDGLTAGELAALNLAEVLSSEKIAKVNAKGNHECKKHCSDAAARVRRVFD